MEILTPNSYFSNSNWFLEESSISSTKWTAAENKAFENALALFDDKTPNRWERVAERVPGKTVADVIRQYKELEDDVTSIEAGLVPLPGYITKPSSSPFALKWGSDHGFNQSFGARGRKLPSNGVRPGEQERKKGVAWTEEEHKLFLMGLKKYGKGDWRNISRNYVISRTPTQVASHAQKYFIRQLSGAKDKRRASIHDITTVNLNKTQTPSPDNVKDISPDQTIVRKSSSTTIDKLPMLWNQTSDETIMGFSSMSHGNIFHSNAYGMDSYEVKIPGLAVQRALVHESGFESQNMAFQMHPGYQYPNA